MYVINTKITGSDLDQHCLFLSVCLSLSLSLESLSVCCLFSVCHSLFFLFLSYSTLPLYKYLNFIVITIPLVSITPLLDPHSPSLHLSYSSVPVSSIHTTLPYSTLLLLSSSLLPLIYLLPYSLFHQFIYLNFFPVAVVLLHPTSTSTHCPCRSQPLIRGSVLLRVSCPPRLPRP